MDSASWHRILANHLHSQSEQASMLLILITYRPNHSSCIQTWQKEAILIGTSAIPSGKSQIWPAWDGRYVLSFKSVSFSSLDQFSCRPPNKIIRGGGGRGRERRKKGEYVRKEEYLILLLSAKYLDYIRRE